MENLDCLWAHDKSGLIRFFNDAPSLDIEARLKYFRDIFPFSESLPVSLYLFDLQDRVLACNGTNLRWMGDKSFADYIDLPMLQYSHRKRWPKDITENWIKNNQIAVRSGGILCQEKTMQGEHVKLWSSRKDAVYTEQGAPIGIIGFTMPVASKAEAIHWDKGTQKVSIEMSGTGLVEFTIREFTVLQGLLNGATAADIAEQQFISAKTVETYVLRLKGKMNCQKQRDILAFLIQAELANDIINFKCDPEIAGKQKHIGSVSK